MSEGGRTPGMSAGALAVLANGLLLVCAAVSLRLPNLAATYDFLTSRSPSHEGAIATVELLVWSAVIILVAAQLSTWLLAHWRRGPRPRRRPRLGLAVLAAGVLLFAAGLVNHQPSARSFCCGDVARAESLFR